MDRPVVRRRRTGSGRRSSRSSAGDVGDLARRHAGTRTGCAITRVEPDLAVDQRQREQPRQPDDVRRQQQAAPRQRPGQRLAAPHPSQREQDGEHAVAEADAAARQKPCSGGSPSDVAAGVDVPAGRAAARRTRAPAATSATTRPTRPDGAAPAASAVASVMPPTLGTRRAEARPRSGRHRFVRAQTIVRGPRRSLASTTCTTCDLVLPCRDEAAALRDAAARVPGGLPRDRRRQRIARRHRRRGPRAGRARRHRDDARATAPRCTPGSRPRPPTTSRSWTATAPSTPTSCSRCSPTSRRAAPTSPSAAGVRSRRGVWPWHARAGNALIMAWLRRRIGMDAHDIAPMRVCRREALLDLGLQDRRFGYPVELLQAVTLAGWRVSEHDVDLPPARRGHAVEGVRLGARHRCGPPATSGRCCDEGRCSSSPRRPSPAG